MCCFFVCAWGARGTCALQSRAVLLSTPSLLHKESNPHCLAPLRREGGGGGAPTKAHSNRVVGGWGDILIAHSERGKKENKGRA